MEEYFGSRGVGCTLEHDDIQNVITQIDTQILTAKARYQQPGVDYQVK